MSTAGIFTNGPVWTLALALSGLAAACDDDSDPTPAGSGGALNGGATGSGGANKGGSGGANGGSSGTSGGANGGNGGSGMAGAGGESGHAAGGGDAGASGSAGTGGSAGATSGGSAGDAGAGAVAGATGDRACRSIEFSASERALFARLSPLPAVPANPTNAKADDPAAAALGQMLFFEKGYSGPLALKSDLGEVGDTGAMSCASCHSSDYLADNRDFPPSPAVSIGANTLTRNAPTLIDSSFYRWTNWGGRFSAQWLLPPAVAENGRNMNSSRLRVARVIFTKYRSEYEAVFGTMPDVSALPAAGKPKANAADPDGAWEGLTPMQQEDVNRILANYGKAIEAYLRLLVSRDSPFDRFVAGEDAALTTPEQCGLKLFVGKARCTSCHSGTHFSDDNFHNIGVPQSGATVDNGRFADAPPLIAATNPFTLKGPFSDDTTVGQQREAGITNPMPESTKGAFRTPGLRGVALTPPYMHAGQLASLDDVIAFYDRGGDTPPTGTTLSPLMVPLSLGEEERADLVAFLKTLTGDEIPADLLTDTAKPE